MNIIDIFKQRDKQIHFAAGFVIAIIIGFIFQSYLAMFLVALVLGLLKDVVYDKWMKKGCFEIADIVMTSVGSIPAILIIMIYKLF